MNPPDRQPTRVPPESLLWYTHAVRAGNVAGIDLLARRHEREVTEALVEVLCGPHSSRAGVAAVRALEGRAEALALDALLAATESEHVPVRMAALRAFRPRRPDETDTTFVRRLRLDPSWIVRRAALEALADFPDDRRWRVLLAADDPHWRVRHALIQVLLRWGPSEEIDRRLSLSAHSRVEGVRLYLRYRLTGESAALQIPDDELFAQPFWDWDAAVLARQLDEMGKAGRRANLQWMPRLLGHSDERVRRWAVETLRAHGGAAHLAESLRCLDDPRCAVQDSVDTLLAALNLDRIEETARHIFSMPQPSPGQSGWALAQVDTEALPAGEVAPEVVEQARRLAPLPPVLGGEATKERESSSVGTSFQLVHQDRQVENLPPREDPLSPYPSPPVLRGRGGQEHPHTRAAALTSDRAAELMHNPLRETSWHVLAAAAKLARVPLWHIEPETPWKPEAPAPVPPEPLAVRRAPTPFPRPLGPDGPLVAPLGVSGHYGLPVAGFVRALELGIHHFFWEPNYATLTEFSQRLPPSERNGLLFVAGTFEADGERLRRDVERALKNLQIERLGLFLVFWVQTWPRITADVRAMLDRLKQEGKIAQYGLSSHNRALAVEAMEQGWNPVMVRHSAAHRGAETQVLPHARRLGTTILTFNNTCYGRLLEPAPGLSPPRPSDCYRYTLEQPGVSMCWTAPATLEELDENLNALRDPELPDERRRLLLQQGEHVYREDTVFRRLVRGL